MDKIDAILNLISERSSILLNEYSDLVQAGKNDELLEGNILAQIELLNDLYENIAIIKSQDV